MIRRFSISLFLIIINICGFAEHNVPKKNAHGAKRADTKRRLASGIPFSAIIDKELNRLIKFGSIGTMPFGENDGFADITDIAIDNADNLYIADSKLHRIFKFNNKQEYLFSFGRQGQGPGEQMGKLGISCGNDGNIYISDHSRLKYMKFDLSGKFIDEYYLPKSTSDAVLVSTLGNRYLISENGYNIIDCYDKHNRYIESLLDIKYYALFPVWKPAQKVFLLIKKTQPNGNEIKKTISKNDQLAVILNHSLLAFIIDIPTNHCCQFSVDRPGFLSDLKSRLKKAERKGGWILPFGSIYFDDRNNINVCYFNETENAAEIMRYKITGEFVDVMRLDDYRIKSNRAILACDSKGLFYGINRETQTISIYRLYKPGNLERN